MEEINSFMSGAGMPNGAPCVPIGADPCCLVKGEYFTYSPKCFFSTTSSYTSIFLVFAGPLAIAGSQTTDKTPDRCSYWGAFLAPYQVSFFVSFSLTKALQYWGPITRDREAQADDYFPLRRIRHEDVGFPMYEDTMNYFGWFDAKADAEAQSYTLLLTEVHEYLGLMEELEHYDLPDNTAVMWHRFNTLYPNSFSKTIDLPSGIEDDDDLVSSHYWDIDTKSDEASERWANSDPRVCALAGIVPNFFTDPSYYPRSTTWPSSGPRDVDGYQAPTEYMESVPWNEQLTPDPVGNKGGWEMMVQPYEACLGMMLMHGHCYSDYYMNTRSGILPRGYTWPFTTRRLDYWGLGGESQKGQVQQHSYCPDGARSLMEHKLVFTNTGHDAYDRAMTNSMCITIGSLATTAHNAGVLAKIYHLAKGNPQFTPFSYTHLQQDPILPAFWAEPLFLARWRQVPAWLWLSTFEEGDYSLLCDHYQLLYQGIGGCEAGLATLAAAMAGNPIQRFLGLGHGGYYWNYARIQVPVNGVDHDVRSRIEEFETFVRHFIWPNSAQNALWDNVHNQSPLTFPIGWSPPLNVPPPPYVSGTVRHHHRHTRNLLLNMSNWWTYGAPPYGRWDDEGVQFLGAYDGVGQTRSARYKRKFDPIGLVQVLYFPSFFVCPN